MQIKREQSKDYNVSERGRGWGPVGSKGGGHYLSRASRYTFNNNNNNEKRLLIIGHYFRTRFPKRSAQSRRRRAARLTSPCRHV